MIDVNFIFLLIVIVCVAVAFAISAYNRGYWAGRKSVQEWVLNELQRKGDE